MLLSQITDSAEFEVLFSQFELRQFQLWKASKDPAEREVIWLKGQISQEVKQQLKNTAASTDNDRTHSATA